MLLLLCSLLLGGIQHESSFPAQKIFPHRQHAATAEVSIFLDQVVLKTYNRSDICEFFICRNRNRLHEEFISALNVGAGLLLEWLKNDCTSQH